MFPFPPEEDVDEDSVNNSRGLESSRGNLVEKRAEIAGRTRTDHATLAFLKRTTLRPLVEKIPPQLFFPACTAVTLVNARLDTGGKKLKTVPILRLVSITPPLVSWIAARVGASARF